VPIRLPGGDKYSSLCAECFPLVTGQERHAVLHGPGQLVDLNLVETRKFPDGVLLTRYETRR
jgi:hypothetical protein